MTPGPLGVLTRQLNNGNLPPSLRSHPRVHSQETGARAGIRCAGRQVVAMLLLRTDWHDHPMFDNASEDERLGWIAILCELKRLGRRGLRIDLDSISVRYKISQKALRSTLRQALKYGEIIIRRRRIWIADWREWTSTTAGRNRPGYTQKLRESILRRDNRTCFYCGGCANCVDHITPYSRTGDNSPENLVAACIECNSRKGARTPSEAGMAPVGGVSK